MATSRTRRKSRCYFYGLQLCCRSCSSRKKPCWAFCGCLNLATTSNNGIWCLTLPASRGWPRRTWATRLLGSRLGKLGCNGWDLSSSGSDILDLCRAGELRLDGRTGKEVTARGKMQFMQGTHQEDREGTFWWDYVNLAPRRARETDGHTGARLWNMLGLQ